MTADERPLALQAIDALFECHEGSPFLDWCEDVRENYGLSWADIADDLERRFGIVATRQTYMKWFAQYAFADKDPA